MDVIMPQLGETVSEGKVSAWFKSPGDLVAAGENLFEIETDKVSMEVQAIASGVLSEVRVQTGETAPVGAVVAVIGDGGARISPSPLAGEGRGRGESPGLRHPTVRSSSHPSMRPTPRPVITARRPARTASRSPRWRGG